jgi:TP901-1 family phage major tail protein
MPLFSGRDFLLQARVAGTYQLVGGLRANGIELNNTLIDASHMASGAWRLIRPATGVSHLRLSAAGLFEDSAAEQLIRSAAFANAAVDCRLVFANQDRLTGLFLIGGYQSSADADGEETFSLTLESAGAVTFEAGLP